MSESIAIVETASKAVGSAARNVAYRPDLKPGASLPTRRERDAHGQADRSPRAAVYCCSTCETNCSM